MMPTDSFTSPKIPNEKMYDTFYYVIFIISMIVCATKILILYGPLLENEHRIRAEEVLVDFENCSSRQLSFIP